MLGTSSFDRSKPFFSGIKLHGDRPAIHGDAKSSRSFRLRSIKVRHDGCRVFVVS
jgi:hypothetical protein